MLREGKLWIKLKQTDPEEEEFRLKLGVRHALRGVPSETLTCLKRRVSLRISLPKRSWHPCDALTISHFSTKKVNRLPEEGNGYVFFFD